MARPAARPAGAGTANGTACAAAGAVPYTNGTRAKVPSFTLNDPSTTFWSEPAGRRTSTTRGWTSPEGAPPKANGSRIPCTGMVKASSSFPDLSRSSTEKLRSQLAPDTCTEYPHSFRGGPSKT